VSAASVGLVSSPPERPCENTVNRDAPLNELESDATDFPASKGDMAVPAMPGAGLVMIEVKLILGSLKTILDGPAMTFTDTSLWMDVPLGHHVEKKVKLPSAMLRRIRSPRDRPAGDHAIGKHRVGTAPTGPLPGGGRS
jgi:hypothetical protein